MSTGFNATDPAAVKSYGYRSHALHEKNIGGLLALSEVSYNGFTFPPAITAKATVVPEPNKAKNTTKWHTIVLTIECIITPYDVDLNNATNKTIDVHMDNIKARLSQRCQPLSFTLQGFGNFTVNYTGNSFIAPTGAGVFDVNNGPVPQVIEWEPLGMSRCARIQWLVTTCIPACSQTSGLSGITDLGYEIKWSVPEGGFWKRSVDGYIELACTRTPNINNIHADPGINIAQLKNAYDNALGHINRTFPPLDAWSRQQEFKLSADRRTLTFSFVDTENPTGQAYPRGVTKISLVESLSAQMKPGNFETWMWRLRGDITVSSPRKNSSIANNKKIAYFIFGIILRSRVNSATVPKVNNVEIDSNPDGTPKQKTATWIPYKIELTNDIFGVAIGIDIVYQLICPPADIFKVSGFYSEINAPGALSWDQWRDFQGREATLLKTRNIIPNTDVIIDLCHPIQSSPTEEKATYRTESASQSIFVPKAPPEESSWIRHESAFKFDTQYFTEAGVLLSEGASEQYDNTTNLLTADKDKQLQVTNNRSAGQPAVYKPADTTTSAEPVTIVTITGVAERIGYPINAPVLQSIGGVAAVKYGKDQIIKSSSQSGFIGPNGKTVRMHRLKWKRSYVLKGSPRNWEALSTNHSELYT